MVEEITMADITIDILLNFKEMSGPAQILANGTKSLEKATNNLKSIRPQSMSAPMIIPAIGRGFRSKFKVRSPPKVTTSTISSRQFNIEKYMYRPLGRSKAKAKADYEDLLNRKPLRNILNEDYEDVLNNKPLRDILKDPDDRVIYGANPASGIKVAASKSTTLTTADLDRAIAEEKVKARRRIIDWWKTYDPRFDDKNNPEIEFELKIRDYNLKNNELLGR